MAELRIRGRIVAPAWQSDDGVVEIAGDRVTAVVPTSDWTARHPGVPVPPFLGIVTPGLVDIHNHGGCGSGFDTVDPAEAVAAARWHHGRGTTTLLGSIVTGPPDLMVAQTAALRVAAAAGGPAGIHLEGPFLSEKRCGAQDSRYLIDPDPALADRLLTAADGRLRVMTMAPERPGFAAVARQLDAAGVVVAVGHSDADYATFGAALTPGGPAGLVTHLANAMPPLHHRAPGPVAAALVAAAGQRVVAELIGDGVHLESGFAALVFATAPDRVALVTDAMRAAGLPDGDYRLGARPVRVDGGVARIADGSGTVGAIAGGTATLLDCVRWAVRDCGTPLATAVRAATATPAAAAGLPDVGDLRAGVYADVIVLDSELGLRRVLRQGQWLT